MNIDLYDLNVVTAAAEGSSLNDSSSTSTSSSSSSVTTTTNDAPVSSLNEEVTQMFSQLGRFWGGVRKQSQSVLESARKDLGQVVSQAQKEIEKQFHTPITPATSDRSNETPATAEADSEVAEGNPQPESNANTPSAFTSTPTSTTATTTTFFSRLQSSLPPSITPASLSGTLQHSFNLERASADIAQLRATLVDNIQRAQSETTIQQAEKLAEQYLQKGEAFFKEAGEFLKDAVKVLPPEGDDTPGVVWDGTDVWPIPSTTPPLTSRKGKEKEEHTTPSSAPRSLGKRKEILLRKLHSNPDEIRKNPEEETDAIIRDLWSSFTKEFESNGSIQSKVWKDKIEAVNQRKDEDTTELLNVHKQLVPVEMSDETFWMRYFFRIAQIQQEEERRKALLEGTTKQGEDQDEFTWEDEDEDEKEVSTEPKATIADEITSSVPTIVPSLSPKPASTTQTPSISPRRSEDSYDVVSSNVSSTGQKSPGTKQKETREDEGDDSDWE